MIPSAPYQYGLFLDIQGTQSPEHSLRGIARYVGEHARALLKHAGLVHRLGLNPLLPFPMNLNQELALAPQLVWSTVSEFRQALEKGPIGYYMMSPFELGHPSDALVPPYAIRAGVPLIVTLYDLIPLLRPDYYLADPNFERRYRVRLETVRNADLILTISNHSRLDAIRLLEVDEGRVVTIGAGVSPFFAPADGQDQFLGLPSQAFSDLRKPFVLSVSGAEERKNTERLIRAYGRLPKQLRDDLQLVIVCQLTEGYARLWREQVVRAGLDEKEVVFAGLVSDATLRALYQKARLFVFPSMYEGFGLPAAEAAACGCPTITSNTSSLPEVLNFPDSTFDPNDTGAISLKIERGVVDDNFREALRVAARRAGRTHTWDAVAEKTVHSLSLLPWDKGSPRRVPRVAMRIALAGPFPPTVSGIADYNLRLSQELGRRCDLTLLTVCEADRGLAHAVGPVRCFPLTSLGRTLSPASFDAIVYTFGNNEHHHETYEMALRFPGYLWLHDIRLAGFYVSYGLLRAGPSGLESFMKKKLKAMYGRRLPLPLRLHPSLIPEDYPAFGIGMTRELVTSSKGVMVNSRLALRLLQMDQPPLGQLPPSKVIQLAVPEPRPPSQQNASETPMIASFGIVAEVKAPVLLIDALAMIIRQGPVRLAFVGPVNAVYRARLEQHADEAGVKDSVQFTGHLARQDYERFLAESRCAVQVRLTTNGESSASINDCLSAGLPVITNVAACREMPAGTVDFLDEELNARGVANRVGRMIADAGARARYAAGGLAYGGTRNFGETARELLAFVGNEPCPGPAGAAYASSVPTEATTEVT